MSAVTSSRIAAIWSNVLKTKPVQCWPCSVSTRSSSPAQAGRVGALLPARQRERPLELLEVLVEVASELRFALARVQANLRGGEASRALRGELVANDFDDRPRSPVREIGVEALRAHDVVPDAQHETGPLARADPRRLQGFPGIAQQHGPTLGGLCAFAAGVVGVHQPDADDLIGKIPKSSLTPFTVPSV